MRPVSACPATCSGAVLPSAYDRVLATPFGTYAAKLVEHEKYGVTVAMRNNHVTENPLDEIAGKSRLVPDGHGMLEVARRMGISGLKAVPQGFCAAGD